MCAITINSVLVCGYVCVLVCVYCNIAVFLGQLGNISVFVSVEHD